MSLVLSATLNGHEPNVCLKVVMPRSPTQTAGRLCETKRNVGRQSKHQHCDAALEQSPGPRCDQQTTEVARSKDQRDKPAEGSCGCAGREADLRVDRQSGLSTEALVPASEPPRRPQSQPDQHGVDHDPSIDQLQCRSRPASIAAATAEIERLERRAKATAQLRFVGECRDAGICPWTQAGTPDGTRRLAALLADALQLRRKRLEPLYELVEFTVPVEWKR